MAPPRTYRTEALILKSVSFGEGGLLVTLLTRESGKTRAVAKGARRLTSKLVGQLEPLTFTRLSMVRGRNLETVDQAETLDAFTLLKSDLVGLSKGLYVAELVDGFGAEASPNEALLQLALDTLAAIGRSPENPLPLFCFQLHLLSVSGLLPELQCCVACRSELEPGGHRYSVASGGVVCPGCVPGEPGLRPLSLRALKVLRMLARTSPSGLPSLALNEGLVLELRAVLSGTVQYWLDKEVRSQAFLNHLSRSGDDTAAVSR